MKTGNRCPAGSLHPFKRAITLGRRIIALQEEHFDPDASHGIPTALRLALAQLPEYISRGHGGRHRTKNKVIGGAWSQDRSIYTPHQNTRECARRANHAPI